MLPLMFLLALAQAQPTPPSQLTIDDAFAPAVDRPDFPLGKGPLVLVDENHRNVVSLETYLRPVGRWLERLGYRVAPMTSGVAEVGLAFARDDPAVVAVIANAQAPEGSPAGTSAFTDEEVAEIGRWVLDGGGLLLVADRTPFGAPARALAKAFGVTLDDNTILMKGADGRPNGDLEIDVAANGSPHAVLDGVTRIKYVVGESVAGPGVVLRAPAGAYSGPTAQAVDGPSAAGKPIVLAFEHGKGRVVVIGDAGVISAFGSVRGTGAPGPILAGSARRGISEADNARFVRNMLRWLAGAS